MAYITTERKAIVESDLAAVLAQIAAIQAAFLTYSTNGTDSYTFDSGTGRQTEKFTSPMEMIKVLNGLEAKRDRLYRELNGKLLLHQKLRR